MRTPTTFRLNHVERLRVKAAARVRDESFSDFVRAAALEKAVKVLSEARREALIEEVEGARV